MAVTLRQVATQSGMSVQTVSDVLGERAHLFRAETRARVVEAARKLGYRPNTFAQAMRRGRFGGISLLLSNDSRRSHMPTGLLDGIQDVLSPNDLHLNLACFPDEKLTSEGFVPKILRQLMSDGLLVNYTDHIPAKMIDLVEQCQIPAMWLNTQRDEGVIYPDDAAAARYATEELLKRGHTRVAYVNYSYDPDQDSPHYSVAARYENYAKAMTDAGLTPQAVWGNRALAEWRVAPSERIRLAAEWLRQPDRPTAVVTYSPYTATPLFLAATTVCGLAVPRDLSIITFTDVATGELGIPIAAMLLPEREIGRAAVTSLLQKIESPGLRLPPLAIPFKFDPGNTLGAPSAQA
jgi:DNA-binding LacI/PurR family transcriptional regulator